MPMLANTASVRQRRLTSAKRRRRPVNLASEPQSNRSKTDFSPRFAEDKGPSFTTTNTVRFSGRNLGMTAASRRRKRANTTKIIACGCLLGVGTTVTAFGGAFSPPAPRPPLPPSLFSSGDRKNTGTISDFSTRRIAPILGDTYSGSSRALRGGSLSMMSRRRGASGGRVDNNRVDGRATPGWQSTGNRVHAHGNDRPSAAPPLSMSAAVMERPTTTQDRSRRAPEQQRSRTAGVLRPDGMSSLPALPRLIPTQQSVPKKRTAPARRVPGLPSTSFSTERSRWVDTAAPELGRKVDGENVIERVRPISVVVDDGCDTTGQDGYPFLRRSRQVTIRQLCHELRHCKLLSRNEEYTLGTRIQALMQFTAVRKNLTDALGREPDVHEWASSCGISTVDLQESLIVCRTAKATMVRSNMRMVIAIAKRYQHLGVPLTDLIQEGSMGLIRAVEKFDPERGFKLSTYAAWWIQQAVFKGIARHARVIRLPVHVHNLLVSIKKLEKKLMAEVGDIPTRAQLAKELEMPEQRLTVYLRRTNHAVSFELPSKVHDSEVLGDFVQGAETFLPEKETETDLFRAKLREVVCELPEDERKIVALRFGLVDGRTKTIAQIADLVQTPRPYVRKIEKKAIRQLQEPHQQRRLREFYNSPLLEGLLKGAGGVRR